MPEHAVGSGFEVKFFKDWFSKAPICRHGPMLLFEKFVQSKKEGRSFYACSACRSRKDCSAFIYEDEYHRKCQHESKIFLGKPDTSGTISSEYRWSDIVSVDESERSFCKDCQLILLTRHAKDPAHQCFKHFIKKRISDKDLFHPFYSLLSPLQDDKKNAQYFLSAKSMKFILETLKRLKLTHILCVGMPTLHAEIQYEQHLYKDSTTQIDSVLLDIDDRNAQFTPEDKFCRFNMFNRHFFEKNHMSKLKKFLADDSKVCIVLDPPFGGLVDAIAETLSWLSLTVNKMLEIDSKNTLLPIFWIFPYFMEKRIIDAHPDILMLDYQVNYENHAKFKKTKTSSRTSPVRIFTNVSASIIALPKNEGYRFCSICDRYVAQGNKHCPECDTCPSKDGRTYVHCIKCCYCVKPNRRHCDVCKRCELPDHQCTDQLASGCHICGKLTHKRKDCPLQLRKKQTHRAEEPWKLGCDPSIFHSSSSHLKRKRKHVF